MRSRPTKPTRPASSSSATPTMRPARCAMAWTSSSISGASREALMSPERAAFVSGRQVPDLGDVPDRLEQARRDDRGCGAPRRLSQSDAALRMGRHEPARPQREIRGLSRAQQSRPLVFSAEHRRQHSREATADQELLLALREHALDRPSAGGRSQGVRGRISGTCSSSPEGMSRREARFTPARIRSPEERRASSLHHEMEMLVEAGLTPMQALKAATSWPAELLRGQERGARHCENRLHPPRQFCRSRRRERRSLERHLEHQEDRTGDEERTLGRTRLPSRVFHARPARPPARRVEPCARDQRDPAKQRDGRIVRPFAWCWKEADLR